MTLFYDPKNRRPQIWVIVAFILIPILLIVLGWISSRNKVDEYKTMKKSEKKATPFDDL